MDRSQSSQPDSLDRFGAADRPEYFETAQGLVVRTGRSSADRQLTNFLVRIVGQAVEDNGVERRRTYDLEALWNRRRVRFTVTAAEFASFEWVPAELGAEAIVYPRQREHARAAIQAVSEKVPERLVYTHLGWVRHERAWIYLHGKGAIGPSGAVDGVEVRLPEGLEGFWLPPPPTGRALVDAIRTELQLWELLPDPIVVALHSALYRCAIGKVDFAIHLDGPTGVGKSEAAALAQQHFGRELHARNLPGSWSSTANALEGLAFHLKDALFVVDDFVPAGGRQSVDRLHAEADRLVRGSANGSGRRRMNADATLRPLRPARGLILTTGEEPPRGHSLAARTLLLDVRRGDMRFDLLAAAQRNGAAGVYAQVLSAFVSWAARNYESIQRQRPRLAEQLRSAASAPDLHPRTPAILAELGIGLSCYLCFAVEANAIDDAEADILWKRGWQAFLHVSQAQRHPTLDLSHQFLQLVTAALDGGRAHLQAPDGGAPTDPSAYGWQPTGTNSCRPQGRLIGWIDNDDLYLLPDASVAAAREISTESFAANPTLVAKRMNDAGLLASTEERDHRIQVRKVLAGARRRVLHLKATTLRSEPGQPGQPGRSIPARPSRPIIPGPCALMADGQRAIRRRPGSPSGQDGGPIGPVGPPTRPQQHFDQLAVEQLRIRGT